MKFCKLCQYLNYVGREHDLNSGWLDAYVCTPLIIRLRERGKSVKGALVKMPVKEYTSEELWKPFEGCPYSELQNSFSKATAVAEPVNQAKR